MINSDTLVTGLCSEDIDMIESAIDEESGFVNEAIDIIGHNFHLIDMIYQISFLMDFHRKNKNELNGDSENESLTYIGKLYS